MTEQCPPATLRSQLCPFLTRPFSHPPNREIEDADEYCPRCDNHYVVPAKTPQMMIGVEGEEGCVVGVAGHPSFYSFGSFG